MIRYLTAGESHGKGLAVIIEGVPAGLEITEEEIMVDLKRRKLGYGRGGRQKIETDQIEVLSGIRFGKTMASPIALIVINKDFANWEAKMSSFNERPEGCEPITVPRPGHADFAGFNKYKFDDIRNILERSSARETTMRVAVGGFAKKILKTLGVEIASYVDGVGSVSLARNEIGIEEIRKNTTSQLATLNSNTENEMMADIDKAVKQGVSLGGTFTVVVEGLPIGLGSYVQWDRKLDAILAKAVMSIQAIKGVEFGLGFEVAKLTGDKAHDEFQLENNNITRKTNNAGGVEGGMSNGQPLIIRAAMKPIPTMRTVLKSVDLVTLEEKDSFFERADVCAVPAAAVVAESVVALELVNAILEKFGGDSMAELISRVNPK